MAAYNCARRLKTRNGLAPFEFISKKWAKDPDRFDVERTHYTPGTNTSPGNRTSHCPTPSAFRASSFAV